MTFCVCVIYVLQTHAGNSQLTQFTTNFSLDKRKHLLTLLIFVMVVQV